jgi:hypothetical protein
MLTFYQLKMKLSQEDAMTYVRMLNARLPSATEKTAAITEETMRRVVNEALDSKLETAKAERRLELFAMGAVLVVVLLPNGGAAGPILSAVLKVLGLL